MRPATKVPATNDTDAPGGGAGGPEAGASPAGLRVAIGIATRGRPEVLRETLQDLREQRRAADSVVVAYADPQDVGGLQESFPEVRFLQSLPGLTRQRNTVLRALCEEDVVVFLDDDFYLDSGYLERVEEVFAGDARVVVVTGNVLADGINGAGLTFGEAKAILAAGSNAGGSSSTGSNAAGGGSRRRGDLRDARLREVFNAYGCNMGLRLGTIRAHGLSFDEALPLYGWYEDVEFSRQIAPYGRIVKAEDALGVHLGVKSGRQSGVRLGYSQIANPVYLARKRSVPLSYAMASMLSRSAKNAVRCLHPEPFVDRRGRLQGNLRAWGDLVSGRIHPMRILDL